VARGGDGAVPPPAPPLGPFLILVLARGSPTTTPAAREDRAEENNAAGEGGREDDDDGGEEGETDTANATRFIAVVAIFAGIRPRRRQRRRSRGDNIAIVGIVFGIDRSCRVCFNDDNMM